MLAMLTILAGCKGNGPVDVVGIAQGLGSAVQSQSLSEKDERDIGQTVTIKATNTYGLYEDPKLTQYVTLVCWTVASASPRPDRHYTIGILKPDNIVNAFSAPGGWVMLTHGLLLQIHSEAELAGVLAHEVSHVSNQDGLKAVKQAGLLNGLSAAASSAANHRALASATGAAFSEVVEKGYDKKQEFDADEGAVVVMTAAGYDPHEYLNLLMRLETEQQSGAGGIMSTHPGMPERVARVRKQIDDMGAKATGAKLVSRWVQYTGMNPPAAMIQPTSEVPLASK
jgi:predicted Zn-dependent protease